VETKKQISAHIRRLFIHFIFILIIHEIHSDWTYGLAYCCSVGGIRPEPLYVPYPGWK